MKKNMLAKKLTTALLTGAMVMTMGGMTALAEGPTQPVTNDTSITFKKEIQKEENVYTPALEDSKIEFSITSANVPSNTTDRDGNVVYPGPMDAITNVGQIAASFADDLNDNTSPSIIRNVTIDINKDAFVDSEGKFKPGVYRYMVEEVDPGYDGLAADTKDYYLDVFVYADDTQCQSVMYDSADPAKAKKIDTIVNTYATSDLTIDKVVSGDQASDTQEFNFTVTIEGAVGEKYYASNGAAETASGEGETGIATFKFTLSANDEPITIYGLSASDKYTVVEDDANSDGYKTTYYNGAVDTGKEMKDGVNGVDMGENDVTIIVQNAKSAVSPTGIAMTFAPYIVMVAFAGVFAVMFLRKKREDF